MPCETWTKQACGRERRWAKKTRWARSLLPQVMLAHIRACECVIVEQTNEKKNCVRISVCRREKDSVGGGGGGGGEEGGEEEGGSEEHKLIDQNDVEICVLWR